MSSPWNAPPSALPPAGPDRADLNIPTPASGSDAAGRSLEPGPAPAWYDRGEPEPDGDEAGERERFHPAFILITMVRSIRGFIIPIAILLFSGSRGDFIGLGIGGVFAGLTILNAVATWWMSSFQVTDHALRLRTGWLNRQERSVAFERIQSIDIQEPPLARAFRVAQLRVETAASGGAAADIVIQAIPVAEAATLRDQLLAERAHRTHRTPAGGTAGIAPADVQASGQPVPTAVPGGTVIAALSGRDLLIAGLTSGRIGPAAAILAVVSQVGGDVIGSRVEGLVESTAFTAVQAVIGLIVLGGLLAWALSILGTVITFSGFTLRREDDQLVISSGLLERRRTTIPLHRVQSVTVKDGLLRQPFGLASVHFVSAGYGGGERANDSGVLFPLLRRAAVADLLAAALPAFAADVTGLDADGHRLPKRALPRYVVPALVWDVLLVAGAIVVAWLVPFTPWWYGLALLLVPSWLFALLSYRDTRWALDGEDRLLVQGRGVARSVTVVPRRRIQTREVRHNWFQRRASLGTLSVRVAGSTLGNSATVAQLDRADADALAARLGIGDTARRSRRRSSGDENTEFAPDGG